MEPVDLFCCPLLIPPALADYLVSRARRQVSATMPKSHHTAQGTMAEVMASVKQGTKVTRFLTAHPLLLSPGNPAVLNVLTRT